MQKVTSNRREFLKKMGLAAVGLTFAGIGYRCTQGAANPNIILINVDDLGWTDLGCFGSEYYETPNIDKLASNGMKFTNGYAACAVCSPTRASLMTGRYPARLGLTDWIRFSNDDKAVKAGKNPTEYVIDKDRELACPPNPFWMEHDEITIAEVLKKTGYTTCHIGKWHLGPEDWFPDKQGFDFNIGGCDYGQPPSYFDPYHRDKRLPNIPTLSPRKKGEYLTDREADEAVAFIKDHKDKPFFLNMCHYAVHTPIQGKQELVEKYEAKPKTHQNSAKYAAMVESVDNSVGKIIKVLNETGLIKNTLIIFTSDNGGLLRDDATNNYPLRAGKGYAYEGGIRVPYIFYWPGKIKENTVSETPICSIDLFPTICDVTKNSLPSDIEIDGISLLPILLQKGIVHRDDLFWHFPHYRHDDIVPYSIIRSGDWKLIKRYEGKTYELFNLRNDLSETMDLSENNSEKVKELDLKLENWLKRVNAKMPRKI